MRQEYTSFWQNTLQHSQKLEFYRSFKTDHTSSRLRLNKRNSCARRRALVKLRISNHKLMTEIGWYNQTTKGNRHCPFCGSNLIKDEVHFLFQCPTYSMTRSKFYYKVKTLIPDITQLPIIGLINELMNSIRANKSILSRSHYPDYGSWFYLEKWNCLRKKQCIRPGHTLISFCQFPSGFPTHG